MWKVVRNKHNSQLKYPKQKGRKKCQTQDNDLLKRKKIKETECMLTTSI